MESLSWLALIFLILAGYSAGALLGKRMRLGRNATPSSPSLIDTVMVVLLWIGGAATRVRIFEGWTAVAVGLAAALAVAFLLNLAQPQPDDGKPLPQ